MRAHVCVCGCQKLSPGAFFSNYPTFFSQARSLASMSSQQVIVTLLSLVPQLWGYIQAFTWVLGS